MVIQMFHVFVALGAAVIAVELAVRLKQAWQRWTHKQISRKRLALAPVDQNSNSANS